MITEQNVLPLFSVPLCRVNLGAPSPELREQILDQSWVLTRPQTHNSENLHVLDSLPTLKQQIQDTLHQYVRVLGFDPEQNPFRITTSWVNRADPQAQAHPHHHSNSMISGVYYPDDCEGTAPIQFHRAEHHHNLWSDMINLPQHSHTLYNTRQVVVSPSAGDVILWPSHLNHSVTPNQSTEPRYSVAFNSFVTGVLDQGGGSELQL